MSRQARLGLLVTTGTVLFVLMLFLLARRSFLFSDVYVLRAEFSVVAGLQPGAPVQYRGITVGSVEDVELPAAPHLPILVVMAIQRDAGDLIRSDSQAQIKSDGVLGNQLVVLMGGTDAAPPVEEGGMIQGLDPMELMDMADQAVSSVAVFDSVIVSLNAILKQIERGNGAIGRLLSDPDLYDESLRVVDAAETSIEAVVARVDSVGRRIEQTLDGVDHLVQTAGYGEGTIARLVNDPVLYDQILESSRKIDDLMVEFDSLVTEARFASEWGTLALYNTAENMEALRRHWLFRRYFRDKPQDAVSATDSLRNSQRDRRSAHQE